MTRPPGSHAFPDDAAERIGVLLVNSGTPDSPTVRDVRRFLRGLLSDRRVVELPRAVWLPLLNGVILALRPFRSVRKYRQIWTEAGSPLLTHSTALRDRVAHDLSQRVIAPLSIELGMLYASPTVPQAIQRLTDAGARRILVLPLFPQYCAATTGAVYDQVADALRRIRWLPEMRFVNEYHDHPGYIAALRQRLVDHQAQHGRTDHLLLSFHGIPQRYFRDGDPYYCKCQKTARLLADEIGLPEGRYSVSFQSKVGPGKWLKPYTEDVLEAMPGRGTRSVTVMCPGFAADCLETLEEIDLDYRERFLAAGGQRFEYVPALNDHPLHARALADLVAQHVGGWTSSDLCALLAPRSTTA